MVQPPVRLDWDEYFLGIAQAVAVRADCTRRRVGAVLVKDHRVVSTGYNGAPRGAAGCLEGACARGRHYPATASGAPAIYDGELSGVFVEGCGCGKSWPCKDAVKPGQSYDTGRGACIALHAEQNAIIYADYQSCQGAVLYVTDRPCEGCQRMIDGAGITRVVWPAGERYDPI